MVLSLPLLGLLVGLFLSGLVWRTRPYLGAGIFIGVAIACVAAAVAPALDHGNVPIWLPALPFAVVAVTLFGFGILTWHWGDKP